jgi:hypothetical protein
MNKLVAVGLAAVLVGSAQEKGLELDLQNGENVVAARLEGTWTARADLNLRLWGRDLGNQEITVSIDRKAIPEDVLKKLAARGRHNLTAYAIGRIKVGGQEHPFLLTGLHGNPHVVWFRERGGDPFGDAESFNVMISPAKEPKHDLLLVGGDFNNQPFSAYGRSK